MGGTMIPPVGAGKLLTKAMSPQSVHLPAPMLPMWPRYQVSYPVYLLKRNIHRIPLNGFGGVTRGMGGMYHPMRHGMWSRG